MISNSQGLWFCAKSGDRFRQAFVVFIFCQKYYLAPPFFFFCFSYSCSWKWKLIIFYWESTFPLIISHLQPSQNSPFIRVSLIVFPSLENNRFICLNCWSLLLYSESSLQKKEIS